MSDGLNDASKSAAKINEVEIAAEKLKEALKKTGDPMMWKAHPDAVLYANDILKEVGLRLKML